MQRYYVVCKRKSFIFKLRKFSIFLILVIFANDLQSILSQFLSIYIISIFVILNNFEIILLANPSKKNARASPSQAIMFLIDVPMTIFFKELFQIYVDGQHCRIIYRFYFVQTNVHCYVYSYSAELRKEISQTSKRCLIFEFKTI